jgi:RNA polymerase sigma-70 factor, ECF subfamily
MVEHAATLDAEDVSAREADAGARAELLTETEFQDLYRLHARPLWAYLFRLTGNAADADDLLQESFCRLLATRLAARDDTQLRAYLFRVATNAATDLWRRGGRSRRREEPLTDESAGAAPGREDAALKHDMARTFRELKPQERMLLWLAHVEGSAHREIAATLGLKAASVPVLLFRARRKLAGLLRKKGYGPGEQP